MGGGGHGHGGHGVEGQLRLAAEFTPFPGEKGPSDGLSLTTVLTVVADPNNPLVGLVSAIGIEEQRISYFNLSGDMETKPWAKTSQ